MDNPWHSSDLFPCPYTEHKMIQLAIAAPRKSSTTGPYTSPLQQPHHCLRQASIGGTASSSGKTDETIATNPLPTPSDDGVWGHFSGAQSFPDSDTGDVEVSRRKSTLESSSTSSVRMAPTTPQMMDILFPSTSKLNAPPYEGGGSAVDDQAAAADVAAEAKYDVAYSLAGLPFGATPQILRTAAPYAFAACPDHSCNVAHLPLTSLPVCCDAPTIQVTAASDSFSTSSKDLHASATCCPPACPSTINALSPCGQGDSATFVCSDASCTDPGCGQLFPTKSNRGSIHQGASVEFDRCVSVCDGVVASGTLYEECGDCSVAGVAAADTRVNFAESLHNLFLDCCHECPDEQHLDACCPTDNRHQVPVFGDLPYGIPASAATIQDRSTPDTSFTGTHGHSTPQSPPTDSSVPSKASHTQSVLRDSCQIGHPHQHDPSGVCSAPNMTLWKQSIANAISRGVMAPSFPSHVPASAVPCKWAGCSHICPDLSELAAHVHRAHLAPQGFDTSDSYDTWQVDLPREGTNSHLAPSNQGNHCQWDSCGQLNPTHGAPVSADAVLEHLLQAHLSTASERDPPTSAVNVSAICSSSSSPSLQHVAALSTTALEANRPIKRRKRRLSRTQSYERGESNLPLRDSKKASSVTAATTPSIDWHSSVDGGGIDGRDALSPGASSSWTEDHSCGWQGCSEHFDSHQALTDHIAQDHVGSGKSSYTCGWLGCQRGTEGKTFQQRQKILRHLQTHTGDRPYKCTVCSRRFSEANTLSQHMRTHTHEKPYICDYPGCGARFAVAGSLTIHKRSRHTNERPFVCTWPGCKRAFAESSNLTKHRRVHSGERPFGCDKCDRRFSRPDQLSRHAKVHEGRKA